MYHNLDHMFYVSNQVQYNSATSVIGLSKDNKV